MMRMKLRRDQDFDVKFEFVLDHKHVLVNFD